MCVDPAAMPKTASDRRAPTDRNSRRRPKFGQLGGRSGPGRPLCTNVSIWICICTWAFSHSYHCNVYSKHHITRNITLTEGSRWHHARQLYPCPTHSHRHCLPPHFRNISLHRSVGHVCALHFDASPYFGLSISTAERPRAWGRKLVQG